MRFMANMFQGNNVRIYEEFKNPDNSSTQSLLAVAQSDEEIRQIDAAWGNAMDIIAVSAHKGEVVLVVKRAIPQSAAIGDLCKLAQVVRVLIRQRDLRGNEVVTCSGFSNEIAWIDPEWEVRRVFVENGCLVAVVDI